MDAVTYAKSKRYTNETAQEFGGLKGANCEIQSITPITGGNRITFLWQNSSGATQSSTLDVMDGTDGQNGLDGQDGLSVASATINTSNNHLILTMSDSSTIDCGEVPTVQGEPGAQGEQGFPGEDGFTPTIEIKTSTTDTYVLTITNRDGSYDTPNLKGGGGSGGASALSDLTDVSLLNLRNGQIIKYNSTAHKWENADGIEINSIGDIADVDISNLQDNQIIIWDAASGKWKNVYQLPQIQFTTMVEASTMPQAVVQYIGNDTADYKRGFFYRSNPHIESGSVVYVWEQLNVQQDNTDYELLSNLPEIAGTQIIGNKSLEDLGIQGKVQFTTMESPVVGIAGKIVQYIGATTDDFKTGYWYQCIYDVTTTSYVWTELNVSDNTVLANRVTQLETNVGDISTLTVPSVTDLVSAINAISDKGLTSIVYTEPNLVITYADGSTYSFNVRDSVLRETQIGELANVSDSLIANGNVLQYDSSIQGYKPYDIVTTLTSLLQDAKDYTDQEIASSITQDAISCDAKPQYDAVNDLVIYFQNGQAHSTDKTDTRFYYTVSGDSFCSSWIGGVEYTFSIADVDFDDLVNKNTDVVATYTEDMVDKTKIPDIAALDALLAIVKTALGLKVSTADIVDNLSSQATNKPLSANQGKVLSDLIDNKQDIMQYDTLPASSALTLGKVVQYVGATSQAYKQGSFYVSVYDNATTTYSWEEVVFAPDMVEITAAEVDAMWA